MKPCEIDSMGRKILVLFGVLALLSLFTQVLLRYAALSSNVFDLGLFMTGLFNSGREWQRAFFGHVHPLMPLYGMIYAHLPNAAAPYALIGGQAALLIISTIWIWRVFGPWPGFAMAVYYPLWANALFDFHFDHLAVPILTGFYVACEKRRFGWAMIAASSLVLVKEPFALQTSACGIYLICLVWKQDEYHKVVKFAGAMLVAGFGFAFFYAATNWFLPYFTMGSTRGGLDSSAFSWLGHSLREMAATLLTRPDRILQEIFLTPGKLIYLLVIFGSLAFIPLLRPAALIPAAPLLLIALLSRFENYYSYANHYTAGVIVPVIVAFRDGLPTANRWVSAILRWMNSHFEFWNKQNDRGTSVYFMLLFWWVLACHVALASSPISRLFWSDKVWSYSRHAYVPTERNSMIKRAISAHIPMNSSIVVTTQNTLNWAYLAHRESCLPFPAGMDEAQAMPDWSSRSVGGFWKFVETKHLDAMKTYYRYADYVVLDMKRPWFIMDRGCMWLYGRCTDENIADKFLSQVKSTMAGYQPIFNQDGFMILQRKPGLQ